MYHFTEDKAMIPGNSSLDGCSRNPSTTHADNPLAVKSSPSRDCRELQIDPYVYGVAPSLPRNELVESACDVRVPPISDCHHSERE